MASGYDIKDLDGSIFGPELKRQLARQRCQADGCGGELRWTVPQREIQLGQTLTVTGTCLSCGEKYEVQFEL
jgi:hypothetical protein